MSGKIQDEDEFLDEVDQHDPGNTFKAVSKLLVIIICYSVAFISLVQWGFWISDVPHFNSTSTTSLYDWVIRSYTEGSWWNSNTKSLLGNCGLMLIFGAQHSLMSERFLWGTGYWDLFHDRLKIDKAIYTVMTGIVLHIVVLYWQPISIMVWTIDIISGDQYYFKYVHIFAWASFYGSSLMLDLPDLIGLNQVVVKSPTLTVKSPQLKQLYKSQRHMGFVPFTVILVFHPYMSLDRFALALSCILYTYFSWTSEGCYDYAREMSRIKKLRIE